MYVNIVLAQDGTNVLLSLLNISDKDSFQYLGPTKYHH